MKTERKKNLLNEDEMLHRLIIRENAKTVDGLEAIRNLTAKRLDIAREFAKADNEMMARNIAYSAGIDLKGKIHNATI